jgi:ABC-type transporter Mla subunit MlaD
MVWRIEHDIIDRVNRKEITMTLYEITGDIRELQSMLADGEDETIINDTLESVMDDFTDKADAYGAVIRNLEADANAYAEEIKRLTAKKTTAENGIKRLKTALLNAMIETGNEKI